jgi:hypothetical protein
VLSATKPVKGFIVLHRMMALSAGSLRKRQMHVSQSVSFVPARLSSCLEYRSKPSVECGVVEG